MSSSLASNWLKLQKKQQLSNTTSENKKTKVSKKKSATTLKNTQQKVRIRKTLSQLAKEENDKLQRSTLSDNLSTPSTALESDTGSSSKSSSKSSSTSVSAKKLSNRQQEIGKYLAMDCEFVGVGPEGVESELARVSIVNFHGHLIYDKFVKPREKVTDWRTFVSGIRPSDMQNAISFKEAQTEVAQLLNNRILVGHAIHHDLEALYLTHPKAKIRDTSKHLPFKQKYSKGKTPSLKKLAQEILKIDIQGGEHSSVEDARATMLIYKSDRAAFEEKIRSTYQKN